MSLAGEVPERTATGGEGSGGPRRGVLDRIFQFRYGLHVLIYALAFWAPWDSVLHLDVGLSTWLLLAGWMTRSLGVDFTAATVGLLALGIVLAALGALLRTWGTAYLGAGVVNSGRLHGQGVLADGPFRYVRNPLYLGTMVHTLALTLLMPPSGALFALVLIPALQFALIAAEERFLTAQRGAEYLAYLQLVPRLLPSVKPKVTAAGDAPRWRQAFLGEFYMWGVAVSFAALGWRYNAFLVMRGVIVSLGLSLVVRAFVQQTKRR